MQLNIAQAIACRSHSRGLWFLLPIGSLSAHCLAISLICVLLHFPAAPCPAGERFGNGANVFAIEFVPIGDPGNTPLATNAVGSVPYVYQIGKFEISEGQISAATGSGLIGVSSGIHDPAEPAGSISFIEAALFVNWLNQQKGYAPAYNLVLGGSGLELGAWPSGPSIDQRWGGADAPDWQKATGVIDYRNKGAAYFLPSRNEFIKAGFYTGPTGGWKRYATGSDTPPTPVASGTVSGSQVINQPWGQGPAPVAQAGGLSYYGTMAQGGNVREWLDEPALGGGGGVTRDFRGAPWYASGEFSGDISDRGSLGVSWDGSLIGDYSWGFRVVRIHSPRIAITSGANSSFQLEYRGILEQTTDFQTWQAVNPPPVEPLYQPNTSNSTRVFFRSKGP